MGKNRPHDLIYYKGGFIIMVFIIRVRILYEVCNRLSLRPFFFSRNLIGELPGVYSNQYSILTLIINTITINLPS